MQCSVWVSNRLTGHKPLQLLSVSRPFTLYSAPQLNCASVPNVGLLVSGMRNVGIVGEIVW